MHDKKKDKGLFGNVFGGVSNLVAGTTNVAKGFTDQATN